MVDKSHYHHIAREMASKSATSEQMRARERIAVAPHVRTERLADRPMFAGPAVTPEDKAAIIAGKLDPKVHAYAIVRSWHERFCGIRPGAHIPIMALLGPRGRGKTVAGAWLIAEEGGTYVSALELCKRLISGHWRDTAWSAEVFRSRVVVLDDVGTESCDEMAITAMFEFVNRRQSLDKGLTLITANLTRADFNARYGERTVDRILHVGMFVEAKGEDLRRKDRKDSHG